MKLKEKIRDVAKEITLVETLLLSQIENQEVKAEIESLYTDSTKVEKLIGTIVNSSFTSNLPAFMLSRSLLYRLVNNDNNLEEKIELYPRDYKEILMRMMASDLMECLNKPSLKKKGMKHNVAGLYRIKNPELRKHFKDIEENEQRIIKEYCTYQSIPIIKIKE